MSATSLAWDRAQVQKALDVIIDDYTLGDRHFHGVASNPHVPAAVAPLIAAISGLTNLAKWHTAGAPSYPSYTDPQYIPTAYNGQLTPAGKTNQGGLPPGLNGTGVTIGLLQYDGFNMADVEYWLTGVGLPSGLKNQITVVPLLDGSQPQAPGACEWDPSCIGTVESLLDIGAMLLMAPGAQIRVYTAQNDNFVPAFAQALYDLQHFSPSTGGGRILSLSVGGCESK